jgi:hypothetical protein
MILKRIAVTMLGASALTVIPATVAAATGVTPAAVTSASARASTLDSPDDAGFAATKAHFNVAQTYVRLPNASHFAHQIGLLSVSVQLWTSRQVFDLSATACTDSNCQAGGKPEARRYHLQLAVYSVKTGALVCSSRVTGRLRCPGVPRSWNRVRLAPRHHVMLSLVYPPPYTSLFVYANNETFNYPVNSHSVFRQARVAAEFGSGPLAKTHVRAPRSALPVLTLGIPPAPPFAAEVGVYGGPAGCFPDGPWAYHRVRTTASGSRGRAEARPGSLSYYGCDFTVYLEP